MISVKSPRVLEIGKPGSQLGARSCFLPQALTSEEQLGGFKVHGIE